AAEGLAARLGQSRALIDESGTSINRLTDDSVRLLELIRASAEHTGTDLPQALDQAQRRLTAFESQATGLRELIADAGDKGAALAAHVEAARGSGTATLEQLTSLE